MNTKLRVRRTSATRGTGTRARAVSLTRALPPAGTPVAEAPPKLIIHARQIAEIESMRSLDPRDAPSVTPTGDDSVLTPNSAGAHSGSTASLEQIRRHPVFKILADNEAITAGYRYGLTCSEALRSLFVLHNETINVWSHMIGSVTFFVLLFHLVMGGIVHTHPQAGAARYAVTGANTAEELWRAPAYAGWCNGSSVVVNDVVLPRPASVVCCACEAPVGVFLRTCDGMDDACGCLCYDAKAEDVHHVLRAHENALLRMTNVAEHLQQRVTALYEGDAAAGHDLDGWTAGKLQLDSAVQRLQNVLDGFHTARDEALTAAGELQVSAAQRLSDLHVEFNRHAADAVQVLHGAAATVQHKMPETLREQLHDAKAAALEFLSHVQLRVMVINDGGASVRANTPKVPQWPIAVFIISAGVCMGASATFHLLHVVDMYWYGILARVDYASISLLIAGSSVPTLYYAFYCMPRLLSVYLFFSWLTCGTALCMGLMERFRTAEWRLTRMSVFIVTGGYGVIPFLHILFSSTKQYEDALLGLLLMGFLYLAGALLYGFRVPERFFPGLFNIFLASHQIFHFCVFAACGVHYVNVVSHYQWRTLHSECAA